MENKLNFIYIDQPRKTVRGKIGGGYGYLVSMLSRVCPCLPRWGSTDNEAQGQSAKLANGVILCFLFFVLRGCVIFTMFRRMRNHW